MSKKLTVVNAHAEQCSSSPGFSGTMAFAQSMQKGAVHTSLALCQTQHVSHQQAMQAQSVFVKNQQRTAMLGVQKKLKRLGKTIFVLNQKPEKEPPRSRG